MITIPAPSSIMESDRIEAYEIRNKELSLDLAQQVFVELCQDLVKTVKICTSDYIITYTRDTAEVSTGEEETDIFGYPEKKFVDIIRPRVFIRSEMGFEPDDYPFTRDADEFIRRIAVHLERSGCAFERF